jgi:hypothetical protein
MNRKIGIIVGVLTILGIIWSVGYFIDCRYAKAADQKTLERRMDYKIENDHLIGMRGQLFQLRREYPLTVMAPAVIDKEMKELEATIPMQADKVKALEAK